jgi:hypothetical protein
MILKIKTIIKAQKLHWLIIIQDSITQMVGLELGTYSLILESTFMKCYNSFNYKTDSQIIAPYNNIIKEYAARIE